MAGRSLTTVPRSQKGSMEVPNATEERARGVLSSNCCDQTFAAFRRQLFPDFQHHCVSSGFVGTRKKSSREGEGYPRPPDYPGGGANPPPFAPLQPSVSPGGTSRCCRSTSSRPHRRSFISPPSTSSGPSSSDPNLPPRGPLPCVPPVRGWIWTSVWVGSNPPPCEMTSWTSLVPLPLFYFRNKPFTMHDK